MSFKVSLVKVAIKLTPTKLILWVANVILKDIAELTGFSFDLEERTVFVQIQLVGESETIDVWLEDFAIVDEHKSYYLIIHQAKSNRIWLRNLLSRIVEKKWKIPVTPQIASHLEFAAELFEAKNVD